MFLASLLVAFVVARGTTADLEWPCEEDFWRDIASARSILEGRYGEDPAYAGERVWYNPLVPAIAALIAAVSGLPLHIVYTRGGAYVNLLAPIALYLLVARLFGRWTALAASFAFLFLGDHENVSWLNNATYSPWLWPENFAQSLFYLALLAFAAAEARWRLGPRVVTGALLGLAMLAQSTPFVIGAGVIAGASLFEVLRISSRTRHAPAAGASEMKAVARGAAVTFAVALIVTLPFTIFIGGHYRLRVVNWAGIEWTPVLLLVSSWPELLHRQVSLRLVLAVVGLAAVIVPRLSSVAFSGAIDPRARRLVLLWLGVAGALLLHAYAGQILGFRSFSSPWHYLFYLKALESVLAGAGLVAIVRLAARSIGAKVRPLPGWAEPAALSAVLAIALIAIVPSYRAWAEMAGNREDALQRSRFREHPRVTAWLEANTAPEDVVLADFRLGMFAVLPAGRRVVAMPADFANPYVPAKEREVDQLAMFEALSAGDAARFGAIASKYGVRWVLIPPAGRVDDFARPIPPIEPARLGFLSLAAEIPRDTASPGARGACAWDSVACEPPPGPIRVYRVPDR